MLMAQRRDAVCRFDQREDIVSRAADLLELVRGVEQQVKRTIETAGSRDGVSQGGVVSGDKQEINGVGHGGSGRGT